MKILLIGSLTLFCWSALAAHFYVCRIKGLCNDQESYVKQETNVIGDTLKVTSKQQEKVAPGTMVVYFDFDKSDFRPDSMTSRYFAKSDNYLNKNAKSTLQMTGYTDATGSDEYNKALGFRRARVMQQCFERMGMAENKILIESKGEKEPADVNTSDTGRAHNRRTVITIKN